ncbi:switch 2 [Physcia stellaris]|nr:switch 2 [Physcia stellaris]
MITRQPCWFALALVFLALALQCAQVRGDADFESVRVLMTEDSSGKGGDPKEKYWHESVFHPHYDGRFTNHALDYEDQKTNLTAAMQAYLSTMVDLGADTWIMHGTLLGWWWNAKIMPWDSDIDVQVSLKTMHFLASYYNMTIHHYATSLMPTGGRNYMLEINPGYTNGSPDDKLNVIDARFIDTETGVFIDITTVRIKEGEEGILQVKDRHEYKAKDIFPLRDSIFEGQPVKIPYNYAELLEEEYGKNSLTNTKFEHHTFNSTNFEWERTS